MLFLSAYLLDFLAAVGSLKIRMISFVLCLSCFRVGCCKVLAILFFGNYSISMKVLVIGGTGHIGTYLIPRLIRCGFHVQVVARKPRVQYGSSFLYWPKVEWIIADREKEERDGVWEARMRTLEADIVIDLICFRVEQQKMMYDVFFGRVSHFLHCGTIWSYGPSGTAPYKEFYARRPITNYGRRKEEIERFLLGRFVKEGFPATIIHPGHISGSKWLPIDPQGSINGLEVYRKLAMGMEVVLPDQGLATLHHVHGDDVARLFEYAISNRGQSLGESFTAVAPYALSLIGCCRAVAGMFGTQPNIRFVPIADIDREMAKESADMVREHALHSPCCSIEKAGERLNFTPHFTTEQIYAEFLDYSISSGQLRI